MFLFVCLFSMTPAVFGGIQRNNNAAGEGTECSLRSARDVSSLSNNANDESRKRSSGVRIEGHAAND